MRLAAVTMARSAEPFSAESYSEAIHRGGQLNENVQGKKLRLLQSYGRLELSCVHYFLRLSISRA